MERSLRAEPEEAAPVTPRPGLGIPCSVRLLDCPLPVCSDFSVPLCPQKDHSHLSHTLGQAPPTSLLSQSVLFQSLFCLT